MDGISSTTIRPRSWGRTHREAPTPRGQKTRHHGRIHPRSNHKIRRNEVKFRVDRDVFADAVAWAARSLPVRPSAPVLAGLLIEATPEGLVLSSFDYETSARAELRADVARRRPRAGQRTAPGRHLPQPPAQAGRLRAGRRQAGDQVRLGPVQPADHAGRGLPGAADRARTQRRGEGRGVRPRRLPGGHRRRSRRHAARAHRRPDRDRGRPDVAARHRPVPALAPRAHLDPAPDRRLARRAGPGQGAQRHRQDPAGRRHHLDRRCRRRGHHRLRGLQRRRRTPHHDPAARRGVPQGAAACSRPST